MEEDIKVFEEKEKNVLKTFKEGYGLTNAEREILLNFIENLINRNKELEEENTRQHELLGKIHEKYQKDYILKSKVREKIEELDDIESEYSKKIIEAPTGLVTGVVQYAFKELLQEGDK